MKNYVKPQIIFEDFSLNTNIAGDCKQIIDTLAEGTCALLGSGNIAMFNNGVAACDYKPGDMGGKDDEWDGVCYHVPTEGNNLFNS